MEIRVARAGSRYLQENLARSGLWDRNFAEFPGLLPFDKLERFHCGVS
jgi:hypothetical protein